MGKVDSPEDSLRVSHYWALLIYNRRDPYGWLWDIQFGDAGELYNIDVYLEVDVAKQQAIFHPFPGREKRVMQWIAKGKLMIPHFNAVLGEVYIGEEKEA